jgi:hypothetical protein
MRDAIQKGRWRRSGTRNGRAKLTAAEIHFIRAHPPRRRGDQTRLAWQFDVDDAVIRAILDGRKYRDVSPQTGVV